MARQDSILIIEDDRDIVDLVSFNLEQERFQVHSATSGEVGLDLVRTVFPSLILLDLGLPDIQGLEICKRLKRDRRTAEIPIMILSARGEESDVVLGLELGADDYVTKPFRLKELLARVRAVLRRSETEEEGERSRLEVGPIEIDSERHEVFVHGEQVELTLAEFRLLRALAGNPDKVLTRQQLLSFITDGSTYIIDRNVDVHIRALRKKLRSARDSIVTVRGVGYKLVSGKESSPK